MKLLEGDDIVKRFLALFFILLTGCAGHFPFQKLSDQHSGTLTVMSYNIHTGKGSDGRFSLERIVGDIQKEKADLVGIQEVDRFTRRNPMDQAALLKNLSGFYILFAKNLDFQGGEYGIAVLSRFPIEDYRIFHYKTAEGREPRGALAVKVHPFPGAGSRPVWFVTTHLGTDETGEEQKGQLKELTEWSSTLPGDANLFVSGDFNQKPGSRALQSFTDQFMDLWQSGGKGEGYTYPASQPAARIDYLFVRRGDPVECSRITVLQTNASDHRPVAATIVLK
jgi:endonuclease/exonuclease/phosphatase family metal-dependent hydrolase